MEVGNSGLASQAETAASTPPTNDLELLFFDTFSHEASEEINLDLVQFPKPVLVGEVRIIPLGARVQADFPGGVRLGATNPSQFNIEFFVNDLSKPGASTFEKLGIMDYNQNGNIHLECQHKVATDGLVLRGLYTTITLAIYGGQTEGTDRAVRPPDSTPSSVPPSPHPAQPSPAQGASAEFEGAEKTSGYESQESWPSTDDNRHNSADKDKAHVHHGNTTNTPVPSVGGRSPAGCDFRDRGGVEFDSGNTGVPARQEVAASNLNVARPPSPDSNLPPAESDKACDGGDSIRLSPGSVESISEGEIPEEDQQAPFEPLSDDDLPEFSQLQEMDVDVDSSEPVFQAFDPIRFEVTPIKNLKEAVRWDKEKEVFDGDKDTSDKDKASELISSLYELSGQSYWQAWIETAQQLLTIFTTSPCFYLHTEAEKEGGDTVGEVLLRWEEDVMKGSEGSDVVTGVRRLKLSLRLAEALILCSKMFALRLVQTKRLFQTLLKLYRVEWMALSLKLQMLRVLDAAVGYPECMEELLKSSDGEESGDSEEFAGGRSGYSRLVSLMNKGAHPRINFSLASLMTKIHLYQLTKALQTEVKSLEERASGAEENGSEEWRLDVILEEICCLYEEAPRLMCQPKRFLPAQVVFQGPKSDVDPQECIYRYFAAADLAPSLVKLLTDKTTANNTSVVLPVYSLIRKIASHNAGLIYLSRCDSIVELLQHLEAVDLSLAYKLKALSILDQLAICDSVDSLTTIDLLQELYSLTMNRHVDRTVVLEVLTLSDNLSLLLGFLGDKSAYKKKSPGRGYAADLVTAVVKHSPRVEYLKRYSEKLCELTDLPELVEWLKPVQLCDAFSYDNIAPLYDIVKGCVDRCSEAPGRLVTACRILHHLCCPHQTSSGKQDLKYKYAVVQLYSLDAVTHLTAILSDLSAMFDPIGGICSPSKQNQVIELMVPVIELLAVLLTEVMKARGSEAKDASSVTALLDAYRSVWSLSGSQASTAADSVLSALMAYTRSLDPRLPSKSAWSLMADQVVKWCGELSCNVEPGLSVLRELLPLPLPLMVRHPLTEEERKVCLGGRMGWAAALSTTRLSSLLATLSHSCRPSVAEAAFTVSLQYSDLSSHSAVSLVRSLLEPPLSSHSAAFFSSMISHPPFKAALLQLLESGTDSWSSALDECRMELLPAVELLCGSTGEKLNGGGSEAEPSDLPFPRLLSSTLPHLTACLKDPHSTQQTLLTCLRILCHLSQSDYGIYHINKWSDLESGWCYSLVEKEDIDILTLSVRLGLDLGLSCSTVESAAVQAPASRTQSVPVNTLRSLYTYTPLDQHLHPLNNILKREAKSGELLEPLKKDVENLLNLLNREPRDDTSVNELVEPGMDWSGLEGVASRWFSNRAIYVVMDESVSSSSAILHTTPSLISTSSNNQQSPPTVMIDVNEIAKIDLKGLDLNEALSELRSKRRGSGGAQSSGSTAPKPNPQHTKPSFVSGRGRGSADVFRCRVSNTSRPPSLHVDDFVALETCGAQPTGPTGYNKHSIMAAQDILGGMRCQVGGVGGGVGVRGGVGGVQRGPRFFVQPPPLTPPPHQYLPPPQHHFPPPPYYPRF